MKQLKVTTRVGRVLLPQLAEDWQAQLLLLD